MLSPQCSFSTIYISWASFDLTTFSKINRIYRASSHLSFSLKSKRWYAYNHWQGLTWFISTQSTGYTEAANSGHDNTEIPHADPYWMKLPTAINSRYPNFPQFHITGKTNWQSTITKLLDLRYMQWGQPFISHQ